MFENINNKISVLFIAFCVATSIVGCQENRALDDSTISQGDGALVLNITRAATSSATLPDDTTLRIYNTSNRLVARYKADEIPSAIYLAADDYKATVTIGESIEMSENIEDISYYGEQDFTIVGGQVNNLDIKCTVQNSVVEVIFDQTVYDRFEMEAVSYISLSNEFSFEEAKAESVPTLTFRADGTGYFILPEGVDHISWGFYGESANIDPTIPKPSKTAQFTGVIEKPKAATKYTLKFAYTPTPDGYLGLTVSINEDVEEFNDLFSFSPQPTFTGVGFDIYADGLAFTGEDMAIDVASVNNLNQLKITSEGLEGGDVIVMENGIAQSVDGISFVLSNEKRGVLTLSQKFFAKFREYDAQTIRISATDSMDSEGHEDMIIETTGINSALFDYWLRSANFSAKVLLNSASVVEFAYRTNGSDNWSTIEATKGADNNYTASIKPNWNSSTNSAGHTYSTFDGGLLVGTEYEYKLVVDGIEFPAKNSTTPAGQSIPNGDLNNSSISAFSTSNSSSNDWASGNNSFTKTLCTHTTKNGRACAYLKADEALKIFAAGNLVYGQFAMKSTSGTVNFGQPFAWESRPKSLRFSYAAIIGAETHDKGDRLDGKDVARVYFAIVDWSSRHGVTAGTSAATGIWDPATQTSTDEGQIIGYASMLITESSENFVDVEMPIYYYDHVTKPSKEISIIISCATSAYGDYMTGSTDSKLWVDDFAFGY